MVKLIGLTLTSPTITTTSWSTCSHWLKNFSPTLCSARRSSSCMRQRALTLTYLHGRRLGSTWCRRGRRPWRPLGRGLCRRPRTRATWAWLVTRPMARPCPRESRLVGTSPDAAGEGRVEAAVVPTVARMAEQLGGVLDRLEKCLVDVHAHTSSEQFKRSFDLKGEKPPIFLDTRTVHEEMRRLFHRFSTAPPPPSSSVGSYPSLCGASQEFSQEPCTPGRGTILVIGAGRMMVVR
mmetsp:Transcript_31834/g.71889  ORF Transcript_31834/g.71889 Transcript_31834/m.71889 type:complete len:236 (+) Transcript_31834:136-843(+)